MSILKYPAKLLLGLLTAVFPVFIAACYGCPDGECAEDSEINGKVVNGESGKGIYDIEVSCLSNTDEILDSTYTMADGEFSLWVDLENCALFRFQDRDGEDNGGAFQTLELTPEKLLDENPIVVELTLQE